MSNNETKLDKRKDYGIEQPMSMSMSLQEQRDFPQVPCNIPGAVEHEVNKHSNLLTHADQAHANKVKANAKLWANPEQRAHICKCLSERNKRFWAEGKFQYHLDWTGKRHKQETKAKMRASHTGKHQGVLNPLYGKVWICHIEQKVSKAVPLNDIEQWLAQGWVKGRIYKDKALNQIQQKASQTHKGTVWVYNIETKTSKMVGTQDLAQWLEQGWVKGRK